MRHTKEALAMLAILSVVVVVIGAWTFFAFWICGGSAWGIVLGIAPIPVACLGHAILKDFRNDR